MWGRHMTGFFPSMRYVFEFTRYLLLQTQELPQNFFVLRQLLFIYIPFARDIAVRDWFKS